MTRKKSPSVFLIEKHYELLGDRLRWDTDKILDLCESTLTTHEELAAYLRMSDTGFSGILKRNAVNKQVALLLYQFAVTKGYYAPYPLPKK